MVERFIRYSWLKLSSLITCSSTAWRISAQSFGVIGVISPEFKPSNNKVSNLRYISGKENIKNTDRYRLDLSTDKKIRLKQISKI